MTGLTREAYGPEGDATRHRPGADLERDLGSLPSPPADAGRLRLIVRRLPDGNRERPERVRLTPENGVPGEWRGYRVFVERYESSSGSGAD